MPSVEVKVGDVIVYQNTRGRRAVMEVDYFDEDTGTVAGKKPYVGTYTPSHRYAGSYRGRVSCWDHRVIEVVGHRSMVLTHGTTVTTRGVQPPSTPRSAS